MARGLARGLGRARPVHGHRRGPCAEALADEVGGEALASNAEVARRADLVVLCHKPAQLEPVAAEVAPHAKAVVSILGGTPLAAVKAAYPDRPVYRILPSTPVEVRQGAVILAADDAQDEPSLDARRPRRCSPRSDGSSSSTTRSSTSPMGLMSNAPGLLRARGRGPGRRGRAQRAARPTRRPSSSSRRWPAPRRCCAPRELRHARGAPRVTSPGGSTARGLGALERGGVRAAFSDAMDAILRTS